MDTLIYKAGILIEALPYIQKLSGKTIIIKYGGSAMINHELSRTIMQDITLLKYVGVNPIVVHGGGPEITKMLEALNIPSRFHRGLRITTREAVEVVQMVLTGKINKDIVSELNSLGGKAIGLCGKDASIIEVEPMEPIDGVDLGYVGKIKKLTAGYWKYWQKMSTFP